MLDLGSERI